jgi:hypothetical protein
MLLVVCAVGVMVLLPGCKTTETGGKTIDKDIALKAAPVIAAAVSGAVIYAYSRDTNSVAYIGLARVTLEQFLEADDLSAGALQAALYGLPIKELRTPEAQLIITPVLAAYKAFAEQIVREGYRKDEGLRTLVRALIDGLDVGLRGVMTIKAEG